MPLDLTAPFSCQVVVSPLARAVLSLYSPSSVVYFACPTASRVALFNLPPLSR